MRILLTGAKGQIGRSLKNQKPEDWEMIAADSRTLDITDAAAVANMVRSFEPDVVVNAAGYTNLEAAENDRGRVFAVNAEGPRNLAAATAAAGIRFIHISSDYVFDGRKHSPYTERDAPNPLSTYAQSKLAGELLALSDNPDSIIIRSSWVFSEHGNNFVKTILSQPEGERLRVPTDKIGCPTYAGDLARLLVELARRPTVPRGIWHYCGDHAVNRLQFAEAVLAALKEIRPVGTVLEAAAADPHEHTPRPPYSVLSCEKLHRLGYTPSDWRAALKLIVPDILAQQDA